MKFIPILFPYSKAIQPFCAVHMYRTLVRSHRGFGQDFLQISTLVRRAWCVYPQMQGANLCSLHYCGFWLRRQRYRMYQDLDRSNVVRLTHWNSDREYMLRTLLQNMKEHLPAYIPHKRKHANNLLCVRYLMNNS